MGVELKDTPVSRYKSRLCLQSDGLSVVYSFQGIEKKYEGAKSGEYCGCSRSWRLHSSIVAMAMPARYGGALSWRRRACPFRSLFLLFLTISRFRDLMRSE